MDVATTPELVAAVGEAAAGAVIRLAAGTYALSETLDLPGGVTLIGACPSDTIIEAPADGPALRIEGTAGALSEGCPPLASPVSQNVISGVAIAGGAPAVQLREAGTVVLYQVVVGSAEQGVVAVDSQRVWLVNSRLGDAASGGVLSVGAQLDVHEAVLKDLVVEDVPGVGLDLTASRAQLSSVRVAAAGIAGLVASGEADDQLILEDVQVEDVTGHPLSSLGGIGAVISSMQIQAAEVGISGAARLGLVVDRATGTLQSLAIEGSGATNLYISDVGPEPSEGGDAPLTITGGTLTGSEVGVMIFGSRARLENLLIRDTTDYGVQVARCSAAAPCNATHPDVVPPGDLDAPAGVILEDVELQRTGRYGLRVFRDDVALTGGRIQETDRFGVELIEGAFLRVDETEIADTHGAAIAVRQGSDALRIRDAVLTRVEPLALGDDPPIQAGVLVQEGSGATLAGGTIESAGDAGVGARDGGELSAVRQALGIDEWLRVTGVTFEEVDAAVSVAALEGTDVSGLVLIGNVVEHVALQMPPGLMPVPEPLVEPPGVGGRAGSP